MNDQRAEALRLAKEANKAQIRIAELEMVTARASFPLPGRIDDTGWVLELLQDGRITVSKAREWLRDYILHGKKGPLPKGPFKEPSVWERAEKAEAALADARAALRWYYHRNCVDSLMGFDDFVAAAAKEGRALRTNSEK